MSTYMGIQKFKSKTTAVLNVNVQILCDFTSHSRLFSSWDEPISRWGEKGRPLEKNIWHARKQKLFGL